MKKNLIILIILLFQPFLFSKIRTDSFIKYDDFEIINQTAYPELYANAPTIKFFDDSTFYGYASFRGKYEPQDFDKVNSLTDKYYITDSLYESGLGFIFKYKRNGEKIWAVSFTDNEFILVSNPNRNICEIGDYLYFVYGTNKYYKLVKCNKINGDIVKSIVVDTLDYAGMNSLPSFDLIQRNNQIIFHGMAIKGKIPYNDSSKFEGDFDNKILIYDENLVLQRKIFDNYSNEIHQDDKLYTNNIYTNKNHIITGGTIIINNSNNPEGYFACNVYDSLFNKISSFSYIVGRLVNYRIDDTGIYVLTAKRTNEFTPTIKTDTTDVPLDFNLSTLIKFDFQGNIIWSRWVQTLLGGLFAYPDTGGFVKIGEYKDISVIDDYIIVDGLLDKDLSTHSFVELSTRQELQNYKIYNKHTGEQVNEFYKRWGETKSIQKDKFGNWIIDNVNYYRLDESDGGPYTYYSVIGLPSFEILNTNKEKYCNSEEIIINYEYFPKTLDHKNVEVYLEDLVTKSSATISGFPKNSNGYVEFKIPEDFYGDSIKLAVSLIDRFTHSIWYDKTISISPKPKAEILNFEKESCHETDVIYKTNSGFANKWEITNGEIIENFGDSIKVKWTTKGLGKLKLTQGTDGLNCSTIKEYEIDVIDKPEFLIKNVLKFCENSNINLEGYIEPIGGKYSGNGIIDNTFKGFDQFGKQLGNYTLNLGNCLMDYEFEYEVLESPEKPIIKRENTKLFVEEDLLVNWYLDDKLIFEGKEYTPTTEGKYKVKTINENSCESEFSDEFSFLFNSIYSENLKVIIENNLILINSNNSYDIEVYDMLGRVVLKNIVNGDYQFYLDNGCYALKIQEKIYLIRV